MGQKWLSQMSYEDVVEPVNHMKTMLSNLFIQAYYRLDSRR